MPRSKHSKEQPVSGLYVEVRNNDVNKAMRKFKKKVAEDVTFSFETYSNNNMLGTHEEGNENEIGLEYKLDKNESVTMRIKEEESIIALEHKVKF